jgi:hypothetical protein
LVGGMRWEIHIQELDKESEPNWESMGVDRPKGKRIYKYRRCIIDTQDLEFLKEYSKEQSILKCTWMEEAVIIKGEYDALAITLNDLENEEEEEPPKKPPK